MRDAKTIMQHARSQGVIFPTTKTEDCLNKGLELLYLKENVVTYFIDDSNKSDKRKLYLLTDHNRLIICIEELTEYTGFNIFKTNNYDHYAVEFNLNALIPERTSYNVYKEKGLFGSKYAEITLYFAGVQEDYIAKVVTSEQNSELAYNIILSHAEEYGAKQAPEPQPQAQPASGGGKDAEIKQIREMHEAGIITKEEMMDLIKSLLNK